MTERQKIERLKELKSSRVQVVNTREKITQEQIDRKKRWITFWRENPNLYIHYKMSMYSFPYQHYSYYLMGDSSTYVDVSTRGVGKTLKAITYATAHCLLFPYARVGVMAVTRSQADEDYETTFRGDVVNKNSKFLGWLWDKGLVTAKETEKGFRVDFWNGSCIYFFPAIDSSRGLHIDLLIVEECRLIKKTMVDSVGVPMLTLRQPQYQKHPEYLTYKSKFDRLRQIYITSNRFKNEWFNTLFNNTFVAYFKDKYNRHRVFCSDIYLAIRHKLKDANWFYSQQRSMNDLDFRMEVQNETVGEVEGAYFTWEQFRKNQIIKKAFIPPTSEELRANSIKNRPKAENEKRLLFIDFSFVGSKVGQENDNTCVGCMSLRQKDDKLYRYVEYITTRSGADNDNTLLLIRELMQDYQADYVVFDARNGGSINYNELTKPFEHPMRSHDEWNPHGLTIARESWIHQMSNASIDELLGRVVDPQAIPCLVPISATAQWNSEMWQALALRLKNEEIAFLIDDVEYESQLADSKDWYKLTIEDKARRKMPYIHTMLMINEAVNLSQEWSSGLLKLKEPRNGTKDSIVALAYANMIADKIETNLNQQSQAQVIDWSDYQFLV